MADEYLDLAPILAAAQKEHELYLEERKQLIEAAREGTRTFDKAVLTFGAAVFGFSIAFLKDIAPHPAPYSLKWLGAAWLLFSSGLLIILLSFLFSHRACLFEIECYTTRLGSPSFQPKRNVWSVITDYCNFLSVTLLFVGLLCWSVFGFENLSHGDYPTSMNKAQNPIEKKGYVPPPAPAKAPQVPPASTTPQPAPKK